MKTTTSDGSTASYYELPQGATQLQDLISHRKMNAQDGEIFRAIYRKGPASHSDALRDARKVLFYAQAEVKRLEALQIGSSPYHPLKCIEIWRKGCSCTMGGQHPGQCEECTEGLAKAIEGWFAVNAPSSRT